MLPTCFVCQRLRCTRPRSVTENTADASRACTGLALQWERQGNTRTVTHATCTRDSAGRPSRRDCHEAHVFSMAAVMSEHGLSGLEQQVHCLPALELGSLTASPRVETMCGQSRAPPGGSGPGPVSFHFLASRGFLGSLARAPGRQQPRPDPCFHRHI